MKKSIQKKYAEIITETGEMSKNCKVWDEGESGNLYIEPLELNGTKEQILSKIENKMTENLTETYNKTILKEYAYDDFMDHNSKRISQCIKDLIKAKKVLDKMKEPERDKIMQRWERYEDIYDSENWEYVEACLTGSDEPTSRGIGDAALKMNNRHGTEMQMVLNCIEDYTSDIL